MILNCKNLSNLLEITLPVLVINHFNKQIVEKQFDLSTEEMENPLCGFSIFRRIIILIFSAIFSYSFLSKSLAVNTF